MLAVRPRTMTDAIPPPSAATTPEAAPVDSLLPDEAALAARAQRGDEAAFAALYERFARMVHAILVSMVSYDEAQDCSQDVFLKAWRALPTLREPARFGPWLATIARNRGRDALKRPTPVQTRLPDDPPAPPAAQPACAGVQPRSRPRCPPTPSAAPGPCRAPAAGWT